MISPPQIKLQDSVIQFLKWLAVVSMTIDHVNKYLFNGTLPYMYEIGRVALPLFVFILSYNLARPNIDKMAYNRILKRLGVFACIATIPFFALGQLYGGWWPLNILFTLFSLTAIIASLDDKDYFSAGFAFLVCGAFVEYWWCALALGVGAWSYIKKPSWFSACITIVALLSLSLINKNMYALTVIPILVLSTKLNIYTPRIKMFFYVYYPLHLSILFLIRIPMRKAGYLFF